VLVKDTVEQDFAAKRLARLEPCEQVELEATEVWLFGSLAHGRIHERSDVDLAAGGIPDERYFEALARVSAIVGEPVDLVPLESASPSLRHRILTRGIRLS
jgi:uncharacterized protein